MVLSWWTSQHVRRFLADERGQAGMEFLICLPLLIGVAVIAVEYGDGLQQRETLNGAVRDAARLLSRAPAAMPGEGTDGTPEIFEPFIARARQMVLERTGTDPETMSFAVDIAIGDQSGRFRTDFYTITVSASITVDMTLLAIFDIDETTDAVDASTGLRLFATERARYVGAVPPGASPACSAIAAALDGCSG